MLITKLIHGLLFLGLVQHRTHAVAISPSTSTNAATLDVENAVDTSIGTGVSATCELRESLTSRQNVEQIDTVPTVARRALGRKRRLANPRGDSDAAFTRFIRGFVDKPQLLRIEPGSQSESWRVQFREKSIPIGVTGVWFPFGSNAQNFVMQGLTGCTAIIVISSKGIWAGHWWEGSSKIGGASSFLNRYGLGPFDNRVRGEDEFKAVAVDILGTPTNPRLQPQRPLWRSLADLKRDYEDPFAEGNDVEVFLLTPAKSAEDSASLYPEQVAQPERKFTELIPGSSYAQGTYKKDSPYVPEAVRGVIAVQYTPYDHDGEDDQCLPQARVRLFYENHKKAVIDKSWASSSDQVGSRRRRNTCGIRCVWCSFAAGMGTGTTTMDKCRIGSSNVGDLINTHTNNPNIDYQRRMCSGDTITGLNRQIKEWTNPNKTDLATITLGGNDLDFSEIVKTCVLQYDPDLIGWRTYGMRCTNAKARALKLMQDNSVNGIGAKLTAAYKQILEKSTRKDFHLYVSGYPSGFFNDQDIQPTNCKDTSFGYWNPSYCPHWYSVRCHTFGEAWLTVGLRQELNGLVVQLNNVISAAVNRANTETGGSQVHFVDVGPYFDNHRWCEKSDDPNFHEPNDSREDTWFFLSGWQDFEAPGQVATLQGNDQMEVAGLIDKGGVHVPSPTTCQADLGTDPDPWAATLKEANDEIVAKNYTGQSISFFAPTRQIKTFHPRTRGMLAYRDSIIAEIKKVQSSNPMDANMGELSGLVPGLGMLTAPPSQPTTTPAPSDPPKPADDPNTTAGQQKCHHDFEGHRDVDAFLQGTAAEEACVSFVGHAVKADDPDTNMHYISTENSETHYDVYWADGCRGQDTNAGNPQGGQPDTCKNLLINNYKNCNNGGVGGKIQFGCLIYEFSVSTT